MLVTLRIPATRYGKGMGQTSLLASTIKSNYPPYTLFCSDSLTVKYSLMIIPIEFHE
jgi:hypothetical protein